MKENVNPLDLIISFATGVEDYNQVVFSHLIDKRNRMNSLIESIRSINANENAAEVYTELFNKSPEDKYMELVNMLNSIEIEIQNFLKDK